MTTSNTSSIEESLVSVAHSFRLAKLTNQDHLDILGEIARSEELDIRPVDLIRISSENKDIRAMINSMQARWSK
jgi:DNA polymerase III delta prime subunit